MNRLLVTAISGNVATGILRSLAGNGYELYGCDVGRYPAGMDLVSDWFQVPYATEKEYIPTLLRRCEERKIQVVLPTNESELMMLDKHRQEVEQAGLKLIMNSPFILRTCLDKYVCMRELSAIGVPVPRTERPANLPEGKGDYIVKPCVGNGSKFLKRVDCAEDARAAERDYGAAMVAQEYLPDDAGEYTMGVFSDGILTRCIVFRRELTHGYSSLVELVQNEKMEAIGRLVSEKWNLCGSINLQMRVKEGIPYVFEVNPRLSGTTHFRALLGFNDAWWWCEIAAGRPLPEYTQQYSHAVGIREMDEKIVFAQSIGDQSDTK